MSEPYFKSTHYSLAQETPKLVAWTKEATKKLFDALPEGSAPILCYAGMSGTAHATSLSLSLYAHGFTNFGMIYVRKETERAHSMRGNETCLSHLKGDAVLVFVDDLVDTGATRERVIGKARLICAEKEVNVDRDFYFSVQGICGGSDVVELEKKVSL